MKRGKAVWVMRVLLVEDHEPFRQFVRGLLETRDDLELVGEAGDGLEAVRKCLELQPDLVLMDIGLPGLNGIEAARRILDCVRAPKIVFLTLERAPEIAQEAFDLGAAGYVIKAQTASDLIPAILAARDGRHAHSNGTRGHISRDHQDAQIARAGGGGDGIKSPSSKPSPQHQIHFYPDEASLVTGLANVIAKAFYADQAAIAVLTERHRIEIVRRLEERGIAAGVMLAEGRFVWLDVAHLLGNYMVNGRLDTSRLFDAALKIIETLRKAYPAARIMACGECAGILWTEGHEEAARQLEQLWEGLARRFSLELFCAYMGASDARSQNNPEYQHLRAIHSLCSQG